MKTYEIHCVKTGKDYEVKAVSYGKACESLGLRPQDCRLVWASWTRE